MGISQALYGSFQEPLEEEDDEKEPNSPLMVPAADILNHLASHNANLEYSPVSGSFSVLVLMCIHDCVFDSDQRLSFIPALQLG